MKTKNVVLGCLMLGLSFTSVFAGDKGGNGGDGIVCGDSVVMLDYVEMTKRNLTLDLPGSTVREKVAAVIERVAKLDRMRAESLNSTATLLINDIEKKEEGSHHFDNTDFTNDVLSDVPDSLETTIPRGCVKEQLVTQKQEVFPEDKKFTISEPLFDKMNVDQKALMVLHESWYRVFLTDKAEDSRFARYMNSIFASKEKHEMTLLEYMDLLNFSNKLGGFKAEYKISFQKKTFTVSPTHPALKPGASGMYTSDWEFNKPQYDDNGYITFDLFGKASRLILSGNKVTDVKAKSIKFDKENNIASIEADISSETGYGAERMNLRIKNVTLKDLDFGSIKFDETGSIQEFEGYVGELDQDNRVVKKGNFFKSIYKVKLKVQGDQVYYDIQ